jgi:hypothetical protein
MSAGANARLRGNNLLRDDLDVPVMVVNSELEAIACFEVRQPDTDLYRYWESAGTCHVSEQGQHARSPKYVRDFGAPMQVAPGINRVPMIPLYDAAIHAMNEWMSTGKPPRRQPLVEFAGDPPQVVRDEHGIAKGGIRLPQVEVPLETNSAIPLGADVYSILGGSSSPFPAEKVRMLYRNRGEYVEEFAIAARAAQNAGVLLPRDVAALVDEAAAAYDSALTDVT